MKSINKILMKAKLKNCKKYIKREIKSMILIWITKPLNTWENPAEIFEKKNQEFSKYIAGNFRGCYLGTPKNATFFYSFSYARSIYVFSPLFFLLSNYDDFLDVIG